MTETGSTSARGATQAVPPAWLRSVALWVGAALAVVLLVVLGVAVLPSWWASLIGGWVDGVQSRGILLGLVLGVVFTVLPLGLFLLALRSGLGSRVRIGLVVGALLLLLPSVLTMAISLGSSDARSVLVIEGPGFRGATLAGIGLTVLAIAAVLLGRSRSRRTHRRVAEAQSRAQQHTREVAAEHPERGAGEEPRVRAETDGRADPAEKVEESSRATGD